MKIQSRFQKNSEYYKDKENEPFARGMVDVNGLIYDGEIFIEVEYGKEVMVLCLKLDEDEALF